MCIGVYEAIRSTRNTRFFSTPEKHLRIVGIFCFTVLIHEFLSLFLHSGYVFFCIDLRLTCKTTEKLPFFYVFITRLYSLFDKTPVITKYPTRILFVTRLENRGFIAVVVSINTPVSIYFTRYLISFCYHGYRDLCFRKNQTLSDYDHCLCGQTSKIINWKLVKNIPKRVTDKGWPLF